MNVIETTSFTKLLEDMTLIFKKNCISNWKRT